MEQPVQQLTPTDPRQHLAAPQTAALTIGAPAQSMAEKIASAARDEDLFSDDSDDEKDNAVDDRKPESAAGLDSEAAKSATAPPQAASPAVASTEAPTSLPQDVVHIQEVEWATPEDLEPGRYTEKAARPPFDRVSDPCGCFPDGTGNPCCLDMSCVLFACQEECRSNCEAGALCGNKRIQRRKWKDLQVFDAGPKGRGLRTLEPVKACDFVSEYVGVAIKKKHLDSLFRRYQSERMLYIMALDNDVYIDARKRGGIARYINHSCEPNCMVDRWKVRGVSRACVFALRDIGAGEELTFDYKWTRKRGRAPTKCHCGMPSCRGTLELPKESSLEDEELEMKLSGHWKSPVNPNPRGEIINRVIKVYFDGDHEYYAADVCQYDGTSGKHQIIYKSDLSDAWEDLSKLQWMILDEEMQQFVIAKKTGGSRPSSAASDGQQQTMAKNYILVQNSVKEALEARNVVNKCQTHCRVKLGMLKIDKNDLDATEKATVAQQGSDDDTVCWKLVVTGLDPAKARTYLQHNVQDILRKASVQAAKDAEQESKSSYAAQKEIVIPRSVTDSVKRNLHQIRKNCQNVDVTFTHSDSKSKQFAKLVLGTNVLADLERAQEVVWKELNRLCCAATAPLTPAGYFKDLGILGGELSSDEFKLLFKDASGRNLSQECSENLRESAFFFSFEDIHKCTIWVQSEGDMGRIDSNNRVVGEADPNVPRKIFFGAEPKRVNELWNLIRSRVGDLKRGVKFMNLGADRVYQPVLTKKLEHKSQTNDVSFFEYVKQTTGASVCPDNMTRNHLRIDGGDKTKEKGDGGENGTSEVDRRIAFAEELILLQIELLRDHYIKKQRWGFGRDWTLLMDIEPEVTKKEAAPAPTRSLSPTPGAFSAARHMSDPRAVSAACMDIAEIISSLDLDRAVAAHACVVLYRFLNQLAFASCSNSQLKLREVALACIFLANKAQKVHKWKRLEDVLEAAYLTFYAGAKFDDKSEEATNWEKRVLVAEREILTTLEYDVFWPGVDWIVTAVVESGKVAEPMAENAMELALSGPVLAAGPNLWLKFGPEYAFAAMAGLLSINMDSLFTSLPLMPIKVSQTAELIAKAVQQNSSAKKYSSKKPLKPSHAQLFHGGQMSLLNNVPHVQQACLARLNSRKPPQQSRDAATSSAWERNHSVIAHRSRRSRVFENVSLTLVTEHILPVIDGICAESRCSIFFEEGSKEGTENIVLEGSWRAIAIAEHLLTFAVSSPPEKDASARGDFHERHVSTAGLETPNEVSAFQDKTQPPEADAAPVPQSASPLSSTAASTDQQLPPSVELADAKMGLEKMQAKLKPGVMKMSDIDMSDGWEGTAEPSILEPAPEKQHKIGGKTCLPGIASEASFKEAGLRWWIPPRYGPSRTGSLCDILAIRKAASDSTAHSQELAKLASSLEAHSTDRTSPSTLLKSHLSVEDRESSGEERSVAMSLQRWPPEKVEMKEKSKSKSSMQVGFSPTALQEMQLLQQLHFLIPAPQGHPNFVLPVAVAMDSEPAETEGVATKSTVPASSSSDDIFSLLNMIEQKPVEEKKKKKGTSGSHLVFQPTPLVLQKVISRTKKRSSRETAQFETRVVTPTILACWFHDLLSALSMCHSNHIVLRTINPDQILIDYSGVAMLSCLSRSVVLHPDDRGRVIDPLRSARQQKRGSGDSSDDVSNDPYMAPELLLGSTKCTKETDMFSLGCLMAQLLLNKPLFSGRDRTTKARAIFKVVGTPATDNYPHGAKFPSYEDIKPEKKKYKRGVEKALRYMLKDSGVDIEAYSGALQLLDEMLHLDPKERITAADALKHDFMAQHVDNIKSDEYRRQFVSDWMALRDLVLLDKDVKMASRGNKFAGIGLLKTKVEATQEDKETKRKALLMEVAGGDDDDDDLYNMDDVLGVQPPSKKAKADS